MDYLTAPWRAPYVKNVLKMKGCIFCEALNLKNDREAFILFRGDHNFVILNKFPYTPGHLMIAPLKHQAFFEKAGKKAGHEMTDLLKLCIRILKNNYNPHGFNTGMNLGQSAGAGVVDHYHLHVVPRWTGDANFMPIIGRTKVLIEDLKAAYERLLPLFPKKRMCG